MTPDSFADTFGVSCETMERLRIYAALLTRWTSRINLIAPATVPDLWHRHIADCAQLTDLAPPGAWADLGSGAGLPGLVIAALDPARPVRLIESDQRKAAFLAEAARAMGLTVTIDATRVETATPTPTPTPVISARALAPLVRLLPLAHRFAAPDTCFLFPKGARLDMELVEAAADWRIRADRIPSRTDPGGTILRITELHRR